MTAEGRSPMRQRWVWGLFVTTLAIPPGAAAVPSVEVAESDGRYRLRLQFDIDAARPAVFAVLADYDGWERLTGDIRNSRLLASDGPRHLVRSTLHTCVLMFCKQVEQFQEVHEQPPHRLLIRGQPKSGDFREATADWRLSEREGGTRVNLTIEAVPDFAIPPLIGPWLIRHTLRRQAEEMAINLRRLATDG